MFIFTKLYNYINKMAYCGTNDDQYFDDEIHYHQKTKEILESFVKLNNKNIDYIIKYPDYIWLIYIRRNISWAFLKLKLKQK